MSLDAKSEVMLLKVHPGLAHRVRALLTACEQQGCQMRVTHGLRNDITQTALYAQARQPLAEVNRLRKLACLAPLHAHENEYPVTNAKAGYSWHGYGLAADLCYAIGDPYAEHDHSLTWAQIGHLAEVNGLIWGGRFTRPDRPHVQWAGGLLLADLRAGKLPSLEHG